MIAIRDKRLLQHILLLFLLELVFHGYEGRAQTISDLIFKGDELFSEGDYYSASQYYRQAIRIDSLRLKVVSGYAESCRLFYNYEESARWYEYLMRHDDKKKFPEAEFWLGMTLKNQGEYVRAGEHFRHFLLNNHDEKELLVTRSKLETEACQWADQAIRDTLKVRINHLGKEINTPYSDFGAVQMSDSVVFFSSLRFEADIPYDSLQPGYYITKLYQSRMTPAGLSLPQALPARVNEKGIHNANICFTSDHQQFFFTRCQDERRPDLQCVIYSVKFRNGKWQQPVILSNKINIPGYTSTQPTIAHGGKEDILYFVSDRPGGQGGKDIWYAVVKKGKVFDPSNLGPPVNTPGDEITPFYDNKFGTLFFSSDWHKGFGGFDIFSSKGTLNEWTLPVNVGFPLNTPYNDLYFTVNENDTNGYLTSNREGSYFIKSQTCCNDIYQYLKTPSKKTFSLEKTKRETHLISDDIRNILPLTLFFANDEPDPGSKKETTELDYNTMVADYYLQKDEYIKEYCNGLEGEARSRAEKEINDFFEDYVIKALQQLDELSNLLLQDLRQGHKISITIKGFSSPLNTPEYNKRLSKRRIVSLINYFREYGDGALRPYMIGIAYNGATLSFREEPYGSEQADKEVSNNPEDRRNSIYNPAAAKERRIQITFFEEK
ncbi:MAG: hypothetical protein NTU44_15075 [Bacteroidetes bacterium]|nr:hypothetical protein [Bacteroidota bacterium]